MAYAWIIDRDHNPDTSKQAPSNGYADGMIGPRNARESLVSDLRRGCGEAFRIFDDDGNRYYDGRIIGNYDGFEPLDDFGGPNAGCTEIRYLENGAWRTL